MSPRTDRSFRALLLATLGVSLLSSGCASLDLGSLSLLGGKSAPPPAIGPDTPTYFVELHSSVAKPKRATMPLTKPTLVSDVFKQMGRPYGRFDGWIVRKTPTGDELRLQLQWEGDRSGIVQPGTNYAIHPNDRVLIIENTNTYLDDMIDTTMRPLAFLRK